MIFRIIILGLLPCLAACFAQPTPEPAPIRVYRYSTRQLPPEPVYNRIRWVRAPDVNPSRKLPKMSTAVIMPVIHYSVEKENLKNAALILASSTRYRCYVDSELETQELTMDMLGTIEEIAVAIEDSKNISVILDHDAQEIRFLPRGLI